MPSIDLSTVQEYSHVEAPDGTQEGSRNDSLLRYACSLQARGVSDENMVESCLAVASTMSPPLPRHEVLGVVRSAQRYPKGTEAAALGRHRHAQRSVPPVPRLLRTGHPERLRDWSHVHPVTMARSWVMALFEPMDVVCLSWDMTKGYQGGHGGEVYAYAGQLADPSDPMLRQILTSARDGLWGVVNPLDGSGRRRRENVTAYKNLLVECDELPADQQLERICALLMNKGGSGPDSVSVTWSGGKSWHAVVRVNARGESDYEAIKEWTYGLCNANGLPVDVKCGNPTRFTRVPGALRGDVLQMLKHCRKPSDAWRGTPAEWAGR